MRNKVLPSQGFNLDTQPERGSSCGNGVRKRHNAVFNNGRGSVFQSIHQQPHEGLARARFAFIRVLKPELNLNKDDLP